MAHFECELKALVDDWDGVGRVKDVWIHDVCTMYIELVVVKSTKLKKSKCALEKGVCSSGVQ